ncbi:hypothetical protein FRC00_007439 [Tulasnella sp. 408]|nr:hypothetical protein FRC00_007439 [Tulasnella sp. 408]
MADLDIKIGADTLSIAHTWESKIGDLPRAYSVYKIAFARLTRGLPSPSETNTSHEVEKRTLAIATAMKMAELGDLILYARALGTAPADPDSGPAGEAEVREKFDWALTEALRLRTAAVKPPERAKEEEEENDRINPPRWAQEVDLASIMGRVADYYSRRGMVEHAVPLYFYATSTLFPPPNPPACSPFLPAPSSSFEDRCQALIASAPEAHRIQATAWLKKAAKLLKKAIAVSKLTSEGTRELQNMPGAMLFNLGILSEMSNEQGKARAYYEHALEAFKATGTYERAVEVQDALRRLQSQPLNSVEGEEGLSDVESLYPSLFKSVLAK